MLSLPFGQFDIQLGNDSSFTLGAVDNSQSYDHAYRLDDEPFTPATRHSVKVVKKDDRQLSSCILVASGGATGIHKHSAIIHNNSLVIAVGPFMASLHLPTLELKWKTEVDSGTCFGVYHSQENQCFISHGELEITRISYDGVIDWSNGGADIFTGDFTVAQNQITAIDWYHDKYVWDIKTGTAIEPESDQESKP